MWLAEREIEYYRQEELGLGGKPFLELLETTHFHLFTMPVMFLILGHIFFLSSLGDGTKMTIILISFGAMVAEIALPWLIVYHSGAWGPVKHVSRLALFSSYLVFIVVPIKDMWSPAPPSDDPLLRGI